MPVQMRLSQADDRFYSPDRDLAYCTPHLVMRAMQGLDPGKQESWVRAYLDEHDVTDDDLSNGAAVLAKYLNSTMLDPKYKEPHEALDAAGFFALPSAVQTIICAKIGQVFVSAFFSAIRDVTRKPTDPPMDMIAIAKTAERTQHAITRRSWLPRWMCRLMQFLDQAWYIYMPRP